MKQTNQASPSFIRHDIYKKASRGFTLIELLVVISIIGLLASIILVAVSSSRMQSRDAKRVEDLEQLSKAIEQYNIDNPSTGYPACGAVNNTSGSFSICATAPGWQWAGFPGGQAPNPMVASTNPSLNFNIYPNYVASIPNDPTNALPYSYYYIRGWRITDGNAAEIPAGGCLSTYPVGSANPYLCRTGLTSDYILATLLENPSNFKNATTTFQFPAIESGGSYGNVNYLIGNANY